MFCKQIERCTESELKVAPSPLQGTEKYCSAPIMPIAQPAAWGYAPIPHTRKNFFSTVQGNKFIFQRYVKGEDARGWGCNVQNLLLSKINKKCTKCQNFHLRRAFNPNCNSKFVKLCASCHIQHCTPMKFSQCQIAGKVV